MALTPDNTVGETQSVEPAGADRAVVQVLVDRVSDAARRPRHARGGDGCGGAAAGRSSGVVGPVGDGRAEPGLHGRRCALELGLDAGQVAAGHQVARVQRPDLLDRGVGQLHRRLLGPLLARRDHAADELDADRAHDDRDDADRDDRLEQDEAALALDPRSTQALQPAQRRGQHGGGGSGHGFASAQCFAARIVLSWAICCLVIEAENSVTWVTIVVDRVRRAPGRGAPTVTWLDTTSARRGPFCSAVEEGASGACTSRPCSG